jgi:ornithine cyclodeaminase
MAMLGAGAMAADQIAAVRAVRPIELVLVWSRRPERARALADQLDVIAVDDPDKAVAQADIVTTATPATVPLFNDARLKETVHINAVGAFTPEMVEIPPETVNRAFVVVDDLEAAAAEAGDLIQAGRAPDATIGDVLAGVPARRDGITIFKSVGIASQDIAAAVAALQFDG